MVVLNREMKEYTMKYPKIADSSIYDEIAKYQNSRGFKFDHKSQPSVSSFIKTLGEPAVKVAHGVLNIEENLPESKRSFIDGQDFEGKLVEYIQDDPLFDDNSGEYIYFLAYDKKIVKIGMTTTTIKSRYASYNCGTRKAMKKGSCSSTNYVISECNYTALKKGIKVEIFAIKLEKEYQTITRFNQTQKVAVSIARDAEEMVTNQFITKYKHKPILCVQKGNSF